MVETTYVSKTKKGDNGQLRLSHFNGHFSLKSFFMMLRFQFYFKAPVTKTRTYELSVEISHIFLKCWTKVVFPLRFSSASQMFVSFLCRLIQKNKLAKHMTIVFTTLKMPCLDWTGNILQEVFTNY